MKHADFLKTLKTLKSRILSTKKEKEIPFYPRKEETHKTYCICKDSKGEHKYLYASQKETEYLLASKNISLISYPCPYEKGWHLTKR